jgi:hypothetical protein
MKELKTLQEALEYAKEKIKHPGTGITKSMLEIKIAIMEDLIAKSPVDEEYFKTLIVRYTGSSEGWTDNFIEQLIKAGWVKREGGKLHVIAKEAPQ